MAEDTSRTESFRSRSRREVLALGATAAGTLAGCASLAPPSTGSPTETESGYPERPDTIFQADVSRTGHWPNRAVPDGIEVAWSIPGINKGDHTAAKPSPLSYRGDIIVSGDVGTVFSFTPDGELNWATALHPSTYGTHATPAIVDGRLFTTGYDGAVYAIDTETGAIEWRTKVADAIGSSPNYYDGLVYVATEFYTPSGGMAALDAESGDVVWEDNRATNHAHSQTGIDLVNRSFAAGSNDGNLYVWDLDTREFRGKFTTPKPIKGPICMREGTAIFGSWDHNVYAVDTASIEEVWRYETGNNVMSGAALHPDFRTAVIGSGDGYLHAIDVTSGEQRWTYETDGWIIGSPVVVDGKAMVGDYGGTLHAVDVTDGSRIWTFTEPEGFVTSSPLAYDGDVYVTDRATKDTTGRLYKLTRA